LKREKVGRWKAAEVCHKSLILKARGAKSAICATGCALLLLVTVAAGCGGKARPTPAPVATQGLDPLDGEAAKAPQVWDPIEPTNRRMLRANLAMDRWFLHPVTNAYASVVPNPARRAVRRALLNLWSPALFVNDVLQLAPIDASVTLTRLAVNSTIGLAGLFDPAERMGLERHHTDFGQTLALYGVASGPYVVLPVLGPTTVRDGSGYVVDFLFQPTTYVLPGLTLFIYASIQQGSTGLATRDAYAEQLDALEASSVDFYAGLRSAYYQDRVAAIAERSDRAGPRAFERLLGALSPEPSGGEVGDLAAQHRGERLEALPLEQ
jgi:phospholipid-binding lipoprotein MlaA